MNVLNKLGYNPSEGIKLPNGNFAEPRPPRDPAAVCDYFAYIGMIEDGGRFMHSEMAALLADPDRFFAKRYAGEST